jgi:hypothetical protein
MEPVSSLVLIDAQAQAARGICLEFGGPESDGTFRPSGNDLATTRDGKRCDGRGMGFPGGT